MKIVKFTFYKKVATSFSTRHCKKIPFMYSQKRPQSQLIYIFHGSVHIFSCSRIGRPILGIHKSLTDKWMWKLGLRRRAIPFLGIFVIVSLQCAQSAGSGAYGSCPNTGGSASRNTFFRRLNICFRLPCRMRRQRRVRSCCCAEGTCNSRHWSQGSAACKGEYVVVVMLRGLIVVDVGHRDSLPVKEST